MNDSKNEEVLDEAEVQTTDENTECVEQQVVAVETSLTDAPSDEQTRNEGSELLSLCDPVWKHQWNLNKEDKEENSSISSMISHVVTGGVDGNTSECASLVAHVVERCQAEDDVKEIVEELVEEVAEQETPSIEEDTNITADDDQEDSNTNKEISNDNSDVVPQEAEENIKSDICESDSNEVNDVERIVTEIDC